jgi:hypothetical protein
MVALVVVLHAPDPDVADVRFTDWDMKGVGTCDGVEMVDLLSFVSFCTKNDHLARHTRDRHRENSKTDAVFAG